MINLIRKSKYVKALAICFALQIVFEPIVGRAMRMGGTNQPEFTGFSSASNAGTNVDLFSGDFSYSLPVVQIPDPDGSGYALSLSYSSGAVSPDAEASWVGLGWNINPGAINRIKRGLPDDFKGDTIRQLNKQPAIKTFSVTPILGAELYSFDKQLPPNTLSFNNKWGLNHSWQSPFGLDIGNGLYSLNLGMENGDIVTNSSFNPAAALDLNNLLKGLKLAGLETGSKLSNKLIGYTANSLNGYSSSYLSYWGSTAPPVFFSGYNTKRTTGTLTFQGNVSPLHIGIEGGLQFQSIVQETIAEQEMMAYGWIYTGEGTAYNMNLESKLLDYSYEEATPYQITNRYLKIPFNSPDLFSVSGEGISGSFRAFLKEVGTFIPNKQKNSSTSFNVGGDVAVGPNFGGGVSIGGTSKEEEPGLTVSGWENDQYNNRFSRPEDGDESVFFAFNGDLGGSVEYDLSDAPIATALEASGSKGSVKVNYNDSNSPSKLLDSDESRSGRSSYIGYHTNSEMEEKHNLKPINSYTHIAMDREPLPDNGIGEFSIVNESGQRYNYGLPVYIQDEYDLMWGVSINENQATIYDDKIIYANLPDVEQGLSPYNDLNVSGTINENPYASTFLLTEIMDENYIDRSQDGPSDDDFGGWTKFSYNKTHDNYKFRTPYTGLNYIKGSYSDPYDIGQVSYGHKEVYYLEKVETKSHIAYFVTNNSNHDLGNGEFLTGSGVDRMDGLDANSKESEAVFFTGSKGMNKVEKLEKIVLYAKRSDGGLQKVTTTNFEYDYSLQRGQPNSSSQDYEKSGKLTLKRVWFEHADVIEANINPYEFDYKYKNQNEFAQSTKEEYPEITGYLSDLQGIDALQNPDYARNQSDRWGNYRVVDDGFYVDQSPWEGFDPAAWHLKRIKLPTGGETLIQYEQDDFAYVQNEEANVMISLDKSADVENGNLVLDVTEELDIPIERISDYAQTVKEYFGEKDMYFKFLYALKGEVGQGCNMEHIDGFAQVNDVVVDNGKVKVILNNPNFPRDICKDFFNKNRIGILNNDCSTNTDILDSENLEETAFLIMGWIAGFPMQANDPDICKSLDVEKSYVRLPVLTKKLGGGVRVKRLLSYEDGLEGGTLYGTAYQYVTTNDSGDVISSGVAANEPDMNNEASALYYYINYQRDETFYEKLKNDNQLFLGNKYKEQITGPLGASLLPGSFVGYSKVLSHNINERLSSPGFSISSFYTHYDVPTIEKLETGEFKGFGRQESTIRRERDFMVLPLIIYNRSINQDWASQGYSFSIYELPGSIKNVTTYGGSPDDPANWLQPTLEQDYVYKNPLDPIKVYNGVNSFTTTKYPGRQMDFTAASEAIVEKDFDFSFQLDIGVGMFGPAAVPFASLIPYITEKKSGLYTHVSSKVIHYAPILDRIETKVDGIPSMVSYEVLDPLTGRPVVVKSTDGYDGLPLMGEDHNGTYLNYTFLASNEYENFAQAASNQSLKLVSGQIYGEESLFIEVKDTRLKFNSNTSEEPSSNICDLYNKFSAGDMVILRYGGGKKICFMGEQTIAGIELFPAKSFGEISVTDKIPNVTSVEILRSGRNNHLTTPVGNLTTYGHPNNPVNIPADPTINQPRIALAEMIDQANQNLSNQLGSMTSIDIPTGLEIIGGNGNCETFAPKLYIERIDEAAPIDNCMANSKDQVDLESPWLLPLAKGVEIVYDEATGKIGQIGGPCGEFYPIDCFTFCPANYPHQTLEGVVSAGAVVLENDWMEMSSIFALDPFAPVPPASIYETSRKLWRLSEGYAVDNTDRTPGFGYGEAYSGGIYEDFSLFNWEVPQANLGAWLKTTTIKLYEPNGTSLTAEGAFGIPKAVKLGYKGLLPVAVAANATFEQVAFHGFEDFPAGGKGYYENNNVDDIQVVEGIAHTGNRSLEISGGLPQRIIHMPTVGLDTAGVLVQLWVKGDNEVSGQISIEFSVSSEMELIEGNEVYTYENTLFALQPIARTGEWILYEAAVSDVLISNKTAEVRFDNWGAGNIYMDDLRMLPLDASMNCTVYDPYNYKVMASFDDQHFAMRYQYNLEGKLIRKILETAEGFRTLTEQQYNTPKVLRNP